MPKGLRSSSAPVMPAQRRYWVTPPVSRHQFARQSCTFKPLCAASAITRSRKTNSSSFHWPGARRKECLRGQSAWSAIGFTSPGPPSPKAQTRTTRIPFWAATRMVSGMRARSSSRYITATFAPTKRKTLPSSTRLAPRVRTNPAGARAESFSRRSRARKTIAALKIAASAATTKILFPISQILIVFDKLKVCRKLAWAGQANESHDGAKGCHHHECVEKSEYGKDCGCVFQNQAKSERQKLQVKQQQTKGDKGEPPGRSAKGSRRCESKHRRD